MQLRSPRVPATCVVLILFVSGCGGQPAAPAQPVAAVPKPVPSPPAGKPASAQPSSKLASPAAKKKSAAPSPFAGENPSDIFVAATVGVPMIVEPAPPSRPEDRFVVQSGNSSSNASQLVVVAAASVSTGTKRDDVKLPAGFTAVPAYGYSDDGLPRRIRCDKDSSIMALVSAGPVTLGTDDGPEESTPSWTVFLDAYYMDVTEVTVADFKKYQDALREQKKRVPLPPLNEAAGGQFPALGITWGDAHGYVNWAGKELPTEAEFEKAARGPDSFRTPWGNGRAIWNQPRTPATIAPVGAFRTDQSVYGVFDLAGNAREWSNDWYDPKAYEEAAKLAAQRALRNWTGPKKAATGTQRAIRGSTTDWSAWNRSGADMGARLPDVGFRGVLRISLTSGGDAPAPKSAKKASL